MNNEITIIQGDTYQAKLTVKGLDSTQYVDKCVFSCCYLNIKKEMEIKDNSFLLKFTPEETMAMKNCETDYDITLSFVDESIDTVIYGGKIKVLLKKNR